MTRPDHYRYCTLACEAVVHCKACGLRKKPRGRDAPLAMANSLCDQDCPGYVENPQPPHLWPGELAQIDAEPTP